MDMWITTRPETQSSPTRRRGSVKCSEKTRNVYSSTLLALSGGGRCQLFRQKKHYATLEIFFNLESAYHVFKLHVLIVVTITAFGQEIKLFERHPAFQLKCPIFVACFSLIVPCLY